MPLRQRAVLVALISLVAKTGTLCAADDGCVASRQHEEDDEGTDACTVGETQDAQDDGDYFYAWPDDAEHTLLRALFPELSALQSAWEAHPLLSRVSFAEHPEQLKAHPDQIPTILHDRSLVSQLKRHDEDEDPLLSLFSVDDIPTILSQPMAHGSDYKLVKKIILPPSHPDAGEEYNGMLPNPHYDIQEVLQHFHYGGFSLVINKMQGRWGTIGRMANALEDETGTLRVGVNLYLTPEVVLESEEDAKNGEVRQGFESHWDWMDVIVIQLSGRKRWSVAREPSVYLSSKDQKRKPTNKELGELRRYSDMTLCPGDVLYIPRGWVHNASTVLFDNLASEGGDGGLDLDSCPSYPNSASFADLFNRIDGPSLHLTFGLLQSNDGTIESLLHHAIDAYFASIDSSSHERVAIRAGICSSPAQTPMNYDLKWRSVLHHALAEVARREHPCDKSSDRNYKEDVKCDGTAVLRQSVPFLLRADAGLNDSANDQENTKRLKQTYLDALDTFGSSASIPKTIGFIQSHLLKPPSAEDLIFHYPSYSEEDVILCPDELAALSNDSFSRQVQSFNQYAEANYHEAWQNMNIWGQERRTKDRRLQQLGLDKVGQGK